MDLLRKNISFLQAFKVLSETQRLILLENVTPEQSKILSDIAANILRGNLRLSPDKKVLLSKHKKFLRCISDSNTSHQDRLKCIKNHPKSSLTLIEVSVYKITRLVKAK